MTEDLANAVAETDRPSIVYMGEDGRMKFRAFWWQAAMLESDYDALHVVGGYGSAKTTGLAFANVIDALTFPGTLNAAAGASLPVLKRTQIPAIRSACEALLGLEGDEWIHRLGDKEIRFNNGSIIRFISCEGDPREIRGPEYGLITIDEADLVSEEHFDQLMDRLRRPGTTCRMISASNSPPHGHWIIKHFHEKRRHRYRFISVRSYDNPYLPEKYFRSLEEKYPPGTAAHRRYVLGELGVPLEGAIFTEFGDIHILDEIPDPSRIMGHVAGLDFGAGHPTAYLEAAITKDDDLIFCGEHVANYLRIEQHVNIIDHLRHPDCVIFSDHDLQLRIEYAALGVETQLAPKHIGREKGIDMIRVRLADHWQLSRPRLYIVRSACPHLIMRMGSHTWEEMRKKKNDDEIDALRYCVTGWDLVEDDGGVLEVDDHLSKYRR